MNLESAELIEDCGRALYGPHWQAQLARALQVNRVTVQRWYRGEWNPMPGVWDRVALLLEERDRESAAVGRELAAKRQQTAIGRTP